MATGSSLLRAFASAIGRSFARLLAPRREEPVGFLHKGLGFKGLGFRVWGLTV